MLKVNYYIICFDGAAAYHMHVYMLYPLQGGRSTYLPCREEGRSTSLQDM